MVNESSHPENKEKTETKVTPITFGKPVYLAAYNSFEDSYLCEKPGYVVFEFNEDAKSTTSGKGASLYITDTTPHWSENALVHKVDKDSCIYVCAGSRIYVELGYESLGDPYVIAKFVPITHNFDRNRSIVKQVIDQDNSTKNTGINEAFGKLLK